MAVNTIFQNSGFLITFLSVCLNILACGKLINPVFSDIIFTLNRNFNFPISYPYFFIYKLVYFYGIY